MDGFTCTYGTRQVNAEVMSFTVLSNFIGYQTASVSQNYHCQRPQKTLTALPILTATNLAATKRVRFLHLIINALVYLRGLGFASSHKLETKQTLTSSPIQVSTLRKGIEPAELGGHLQVPPPAYPERN